MNYVNLAIALISAVADLARNPVFAGKLETLSPILGLAGFALQEASMTNEARKALLDEIRAANDENRALTDAEMQSWHQRHEAAAAAIDSYFASGGEG